MLDTGLRQKIQLFSQMGDDDPDNWVCAWVWPHIPIPVHRKRSAPSTSVGTADVSSKASCGSTHTKLKKDLLLQHHNLVRLLVALGVDACVRRNLAMHCLVTRFIIRQPIHRPCLLERVYKAMRTTY